MKRLCCLALTLLCAVYFAACTEPKHLIGEPCLLNDQCDSTYCLDGLCATPTVLPSASDAGTDGDATVDVIDATDSQPSDAKQDDGASSDAASDADSAG